MHHLACNCNSNNTIVQSKVTNLEAPIRCSKTDMNLIVLVLLPAKSIGIV